MYVYEKNGVEIYRRSFDTIRREADLSRFEGAERDVVIRLIHACGMVDLAADVMISEHAIEAGRKALANGCSVICDVTMVSQGIIQRNLPAENPVLCAVKSDAAVAIAENLQTTRSAGGIESQKEALTGAIVVIGNAPTALFHLLEMIENSTVRPAMIIGCPVGFVGAVESKEALIVHPAKVPFIIVRGRRGGSAMAAAVVNALAAGLG